MGVHLRPIRSLSTFHRLLLAATSVVVLGGPLSAAAAQPSSNAVPEWAYFDPAHGTSSHNMDLRETVKLAREWRREGRPLLWFRSGGRDYLVRDPGILNRARALFEAQRKLDPEIGEFAERMKAFEAREERLDREQERFEQELERIENEREAIQERRSEGRGGTSRERDRQRLLQLNNTRETIRARMDALSTRREALDDEQAEMARQEQALDQRQSELEARSDEAMSRLCLEVLAASRAQPSTR
jgi:hypothetical protein